MLVGCPFSNSLVDGLLEAAVAIHASEKIPLAFGGLFHQIRFVAYRTDFRHWFIPCCEFTFRVSTAAIEKFTAFGSFFDNITFAAIFRALHADGLATAAAVDRFCVGALRVSATGDEFAIFSPLDDHVPVTFRANFVRCCFMIELNGLDAPLLISLIVTGVAAFRVTVAGKEMTVFPDFDMQFLHFALGAGDAGGDADTFNAEHLFVSAIKFSFKRAVEFF